MHRKIVLTIVCKYKCCTWQSNGRIVRTHADLPLAGFDHDRHRFDLYYFIKNNKLTYSYLLNLVGLTNALLAQWIKFIIAEY